MARPFSPRCLLIGDYKLQSISAWAERVWPRETTTSTTTATNTTSRTNATTTTRAANTTNATSIANATSSFIQPMQLIQLSNATNTTNHSYAIGLT